MTKTKIAPLILISGLQRSGTTLIHRLIDGHPQLRVHPSESRFSQNKHRWPDLSVCVQLKHFNMAYEHNMGIPIRHLWEYAKLKKLTKNFEYDNPDFHFDFEAFLDDWRSSLINQETWSEGLIISTYLKSFFSHLQDHPQRPEGTPIVIKTPRLGLDISRFFQLFPDGKLIIMRRKFDAYAASEFKRGGFFNMPWKRSRLSAAKYMLSCISLGEPWTPTFRAALTRESDKVLFLRKLAGDHKYVQQITEENKDGEKLMTIDYEDLVANTETVMWKIADFLNISRDKILLTPTLYGKEWISNSSFARDKGKGKIDKGVIKRQVWTEKERKRIHKIYQKTPPSTLDQVLGNKGGR